MARNDGIDRTFVRNRDLKDADIAKAQEHNEREKETYKNMDIVTEQTQNNVHFKIPTGGYAEMFAEMEENKIISTRGLKDDAFHYGELIFDVNSAYFYNNGGYEFAKQFYADAYRAAVEIVGGEQYILSALMHADERNRAMSEALGEDVFHYHLHVVYVPVVEKQILWSKRCKDKSLVGTVKETIMQVSRSKKWQSQPAPLESAKAYREKKAKPLMQRMVKVLRSVYRAYLDLKSKYERLSQSYNKECARTASMREQIDALQTENRKLKETVSEYELVKRSLGASCITEIIQAAKQSVQQKKHRAHTR